MSVVVRVVTTIDAAELAPRLREEDKRELELASGMSVEDALRASVDASDEVWIGEEDGKVIAVGGVRFIHGFGIPWLVATPEALKYPKKLVQVGRETTSRWVQNCTCLCNAAWSGNPRHIEWLKRIGFTFGMPLPDKPQFLPFVMEKPNV